MRTPLAALFALIALAPAVHAAEPISYRDRPIYSEPASGLQLPPGCEVEPSWRTPVTGSELEVWVAQCPGGARVWLLKKQIIEVVNGHQSRMRFQVLDERIYADEVAGDTLSVQCTGPRDETGYVVRGAHWHADGRELRLRGARAVLRTDPRALALVDSEIGAVDCTRFPEREAMMKRLQQTH